MTVWLHPIGASHASGAVRKSRIVSGCLSCGAGRVALNHRHWSSPEWKLKKQCEVQRTGNIEAPQLLMLFMKQKPIFKWIWDPKVQSLLTFCTKWNRIFKMVPVRKLSPKSCFLGSPKLPFAINNLSWEAVFNKIWTIVWGNLIFFTLRQQPCKKCTHLCGPKDCDVCLVQHVFQGKK